MFGALYSGLMLQNCVSIPCERHAAEVVTKGVLF